MKEQLQQHLIEILELLKSGVSFAGEQAPILIQEVLMYYTYKHIFFALFGLALCIISGYLLYKYLKDSYDHKKYDGTHFGLTIAISLAFGLPIFTSNFIYLIKVAVAPRLYLIELIRELI